MKHLVNGKKMSANNFVKKNALRRKSYQGYGHKGPQSRIAELKGLSHWKQYKYDMPRSAPDVRLGAGNRHSLVGYISIN